MLFDLVCILWAIPEVVWSYSFRPSPTALGNMAMSVIYLGSMIKSNTIFFFWNKSIVKIKINSNFSPSKLATIHWKSTSLHDLIWEPHQQNTKSKSCYKMPFKTCIMAQLVKQLFAMSASHIRVLVQSWLLSSQSCFLLMPGKADDGQNTWATHMWDWI